MLLSKWLSFWKIQAVEKLSTPPGTPPPQVECVTLSSGTWYLHSFDLGTTADISYILLEESYWGNFCKIINNNDNSSTDIHCLLNAYYMQAQS